MVDPRRPRTRAAPGEDVSRAGVRHVGPGSRSRSRPRCSVPSSRPASTRACTCGPRSNGSRRSGSTSHGGIAPSSSSRMIPVLAPGCICDGMNYRAQVWLNGRMIAGDGPRSWVRSDRSTLDVTDAVRAGSNALAIRIEPVDLDQDLTITWIDWNPRSPDGGMGLWQPMHRDEDGARHRVPTSGHDRPAAPGHVQRRSDGLRRSSQRRR